jgi:hypothetical protein
MRLAYDHAARINAECAGKKPANGSRDGGEVRFLD